MHARSNSIEKGASFVFSEGEGEMNWLPDPALGYSTTIISPALTPIISFAMGRQRLEPTEVLPEHYHPVSEEVLYIQSGSGFATIDGVDHPVAAGTTIYVGRNVSHRVENTGDEPVEIVWFFLPPGLEHVFAGIGQPRSPGDERPSSVPRSDPISPIVSFFTIRGRPGA